MKSAMRAKLPRLKIKSQIIVYFALMLSIIIVLQITFYSFLRIRSNEIISSVFHSVVQNTVSQIEKLNNDVETISSQLYMSSTIQAALYEYTPNELIRNMADVQRTLDDYRERNKNIAMLALIKERALFMSSESENLYESVRNIISALPSSIGTEARFTSSFIYNQHTYFACITPVFPIQTFYHAVEPSENYVLCLYEMKTINYAAYGFIDSSRISLTLTDQNDRILLSQDPNALGNEFHAEDYARQSLYQTMPIAKQKWKATVLMPTDSISALNDTASLFILFMVVFIVAVLIIMLKLLNDIIVKRIVLLTDNVAKISTSSTTYRVQYPYDDELSETVTVINQALEKIHTLNQEQLNTLEELYQTQLLQKETQILYLHGQISPHFLYNSMSYIQGAAFQYNAKEIIDMTASLSKVFRYFSGGNTLSVIRQDLECAVEYFNVINMRRQHPIQLINEVDETLLNVRCLKMIYQPILENVFKHAFSVEDSGTVTLRSVPDTQKAIIEVIDNGKGMSAETAQALHIKLSKGDANEIDLTEHIGLLNVNMRLRLFYGRDSGISFKTAIGKGTTIRIQFDKDIPENKHLQ